MDVVLLMPSHALQEIRHELIAQISHGFGLRDIHGCRVSLVPKAFSVLAENSARLPALVIGSNEKRRIVSAMSAQKYLPGLLQRGAQGLHMECMLGAAPQQRKGRFVMGVVHLVSS